jgi:hypothetical protein
VATTPLVSLYSSGSGLAAAQYNDGTTNLIPNGVAIAATLGDRVEHLGVIDALARVQAFAAKNGAAPTAGVLSGAGTFPSAFAGRLTLAGVTSATHASLGFASLVLDRQALPMDECRELCEVA